MGLRILKTPRFKNDFFSLVPARKGSKRVPFKNRHIIDGKPLFLHTMDNIYESQCFEEVVIASDDEEIKKTCSKYRCFDRKGDTDDKSTLSRFLFNFFYINPEYFDKYKYVMLCLPTSFLITPSLFKDAHEKFNSILEDPSIRVNTMFSACMYPHPINRRFCFTKDLKPSHKGPHAEMADDRFKNIRTQDMQNSFYDAGQFYFIDIRKFMKSRQIFNAKKIPYFLNKYDFVDIDTKEDLIYAEKLYKVKMIDDQ